MNNQDIIRAFQNDEFIAINSKLLKIVMRWVQERRSLSSPYSLIERDLEVTAFETIDTLIQIAEQS